MTVPGCALVALSLAPAAAAGAPARIREAPAASPTAAEVCAALLDGAALPAPLLEALAGAKPAPSEVRPGAAGPGCRAVARCILTARAGRDGTTTAAAPVEPAGSIVGRGCERLAIAAELGRVELTHLLAELTAAPHAPNHELPGDDSSRAPMCAEIVRCVLAAVADTALEGTGAAGERDAVSSPGPSGSETWREAFERICGQTGAAASLSAEQLRGLIADSERVLAVLAALTAPEAKVFSFRLAKCKSFFEYTLELQSGASGGHGAEPPAGGGR